MHNNNDQFQLYQIFEKKRKLKSSRENYTFNSQKVEEVKNLIKEIEYI